MKKIKLITVLIVVLSLCTFSLDVREELDSYKRYIDTLDYLSEQAFSIEDQTSDEYMETYYSAHFVKNKLEEKTENLKAVIRNNPEKMLELFGRLSSGRSNNGLRYRDLIEYNIEVLKEQGNLDKSNEIQEMEYFLNTPDRSKKTILPDTNVMMEIENAFYNDDRSVMMDDRSVDSSNGLFRIVMTGKSKTTPFLVMKDNFLKPGEIILTFDDGPTTINNRSESVAQVLNTYEYPSIFFVLGKSLSTKTAPILELQKEYADVSVHGMYHATKSGSPFTALSHDQIYNDITNVKNKISSITGKESNFFRPPYGVIRKSDLDMIMDDLNLVPVGWTIDSLDWSTKNPEELLEKVKSMITKRGKGILLMHDIHEQSRQTFVKLAQWLSENNYTVVNPERIREAYKNAQNSPISNITINNNPPTYKKGDIVKISVSLANVRKGPSTDYEVITQCKNGEKLKLLEVIDGWYRAEILESGMEVYISGKVISL